MTLPINIISGFLFFIFGSLSVVAAFYSFSPIIFLILAAVFFWIKGDRKIDKDDGLFVVALLVYFIVGVIDTLYHGQGISNLDIFFRYLAAALVLVFLVRYRLSSSPLWIGFAIGGILVGLWAIYQKFYIGVSRVDTAELNAIHFGNLSMLLAVFCLSGVFWANNQKRKKLYVSLFVLASIMAILASLLSGTRSGWLGFPVILFALYKIFSSHFPKNKVKVLFGGIVVTLVALVATPQTGVQARLGQVQSNIENYMNGHTGSSVGLRFEMWRSGWFAFQEKPFLGWGEAGFYELQPKIVEEHQLNKSILNFNHLHNQYIEELAKRGLLGLVAFGFFLWMPFRLFYSRVSSANDEVKALASAGLVGVICMVDFCLTQAMMRINSGVMFYTFSLVFIWVCLRSTERKIMVNKTQ